VLGRAADVALRLFVMKLKKLRFDSSRRGMIKGDAGGNIEKRKCGNVGNEQKGSR
jgi:hypothetical protein